MFNKSTLRRAALMFSTGLILVHALFVATPLASAQTVSPVSNPEQTDIARRFMGADYIAYCLSEKSRSLNGGGTMWRPNYKGIRVDGANSFQWFSTVQAQPGIGATVNMWQTGQSSSSKSKEEWSCNNPAYIKAAVEAMGITDSGQAVLCKLGFTPENGASDCIGNTQADLLLVPPPEPAGGSGTRYWKIIDKLKAIAPKPIDANNSGDAPKYALAFNTMLYACSASVGQKGGQEYSWKATIITSDGNGGYEKKTVDVLGTGDYGKSNSNRFIARHAKDMFKNISNDDEATCARLGELTGDYADSMLRAVIAGGEVPSTNPQTGSAPECGPGLKTDANGSCVPDPAAGGGGQSTCGIEGVGWLVCPVMNFLASVNDNAYGFLSTQFLSVDQELVTNDAIVLTWGSFRNIANIAFVLVFLFVIYSQLTSMGISNYGIKRMLPRMIIAAIIVNLSLLLCQLAVDLSNVVGFGIAGLFESIPVYQNSGTGNGTGGAVLGGIGWALIIPAALVAGAGLLLAISFPTLIASLLALLLVVLILVGRKAIIVLLVLLSPLAFVAYLLPNTEPLFKKWLKLFYSMLILFPTIGIVFGASKLAASAIASIPGSGLDDNILKVTALGISAIPFFVVPSMLRGALDATGTLGAKLNGLSQKANGRILSKVKSDSQLGAYMKARERNAQIKRAQIQGGIYQGRGRLARAASGFNRRLNESGITGAMGTRTAQQAAGLAQKLEVENVEAATAQIEQANLSDESLRALASGQRDPQSRLNGSDASMRAAAMVQLAQRRQYDRFSEGWESVREADDTTRRVVSNALGRSQARPQFVSQGMLSDLRSTTGRDDNGEQVPAGGRSFQDAAVRELERGAYSAESMARAPSRELSYAHALSQASEAAQNQLSYAAYEAINNPDVNNTIGNNRSEINAFGPVRRPTAGGGAGVPAAGP